MAFNMKWPLVVFSFAALLFMAVFSFGDENPRGLAPVRDATYMPDLGGILNKTYHNQYGQKRDLSECIVLRGSKIRDGKAHVPAGGLFYSSETSYDARPFMREPFLILGEHTYLLRSTHKKVIKRNVEVEKGGKVLLDPAGYRLWFDYATDHYGKPYGEFALISPSGAWPHEWSISTSFPKPDEAKEMSLHDGIHPQLKSFFMSDTYLYGLTKLMAEKIDFDSALFSMIEYPTITEAVFSMDRPWVVDVYQESFRWYGNKRIYTYRKENGVLVEIRNWTGKKVLASKLLKPATQQEYKVANQDDYCLTDFDLDIHIELIVNPDYLKGSDFAPWANDVPYGWTEGTFSLAIYDDLVRVEDGKPWPKDERYIVRLEADYKTGMLKRLVLENKDPFVLSDDNRAFDGPTKISEVWDRSYFKVVAKDFEADVVKNCYVRDSLFRRTDNLILWKSGRENIDFFIGNSPLVVSMMEDTFLERLADPTYGVPVVQSRFTSYPEVIPDAKWFAPDGTSAFVPKLNGFRRKYVKTNDGTRLIAQEAMVIRHSYVDYRDRKIIIPPGGLYYSTRNNRNIRPGEPLTILGNDVYLLGFRSYLVVKKDFKIDLWKEYPMGDDNLIFWQDIAIGDGAKAIRYTGTDFLWGRPIGELRITKYSGNNWDANLLVAQGLHSYNDLPESLPEEGIYDQDFKYFIPDVFAEGSTFLIPKFISPDFVEVAAMGAPGMDEFTITYEKPSATVLGEDESATIGDYSFKVNRIDPKNRVVACSLYDKSGNMVSEKTFGPVDEDLINTLPQYAPSQEKITMRYKDMYITLDVPADLSEGKASFHLAKGAQTYKRDEPWPGDPRFVVKPDVCGHCYQLNEILLTNSEPIVLDNEHPVYEGPEGYFRIVIDDFDGEAINFWHIETDYQGKTHKTPNLAEFKRKNIDVLVGVNGTTESFLRGSVLDRLAYREVWRLQ
jgi:hypothetical protein